MLTMRPTKKGAANDLPAFASNTLEGHRGYFIDPNRSQIPKAASVSSPTTRHDMTTGEFVGLYVVKATSDVSLCHRIAEGEIVLPESDRTIPGISKSAPK